jgi:hypothetical protein
MFSEDNSALDTPELIECITEGLKRDKPIFLYFDDMGDAMTCLTRLRAMGCADGPVGMMKFMGRRRAGALDLPSPWGRYWLRCGWYAPRARQ